MRNTKILLLPPFVSALIFLLAFTASSSQAQKNDQIPSDLSLDLKLAQDNPDPNQKTIVNSETRQAKLVTNTGAITNLKPQDVVAPQVKTQSAKDTDHPEQTSSEQVVSTPGESTNSNSQTGPLNLNDTLSPTKATGNLVPGTEVFEPDDNAAPTKTPEDNSQTPSSLTPLENPQNQTPAGSPDSSISPQTPSDNSGNSTPPPESNPPTSISPGPLDQPSPEVNSATSNDSGTAGSSDQGGTDNNAVQGVSTNSLNFFQRIINFFFSWRK